MKKDVTITLKSCQHDGELSEETEIMTEGRYRTIDGGYELSYNETEATGYEGCVTSLKVYGESKVIMSRSGAMPTDLVIEPGKKHHCHYGTPYGEFMVGVTAKGIKTDVGKDGGKLNFKYVIDVNSSYVGDFEIDIDVIAH